MRRHPLNALCTATAVAVAALALGASGALATDLDSVLVAASSGIEAARESQDRIDGVVEETRSLESQYRQVLKEIDGLQVYNEYMLRQIEDQSAELTELRRSIDQVETMERQVLPLMVRMLEGLEEFVELDMPFLREERRGRVANLRALMEESDYSVAEKFRSLTEAFQIENDFGRTIETYKDALSLDGATLEVNVLRLGRIGLYYQTNDASRTGMWDRSRGEWVELGGNRSRKEVREGIRMARKQVAPDLLLLRIPAPETAR